MSSSRYYIIFGFYQPLALPCFDFPGALALNAAMEKSPFAVAMSKTGTQSPMPPIPQPPRIGSVACGKDTSGTSTGRSSRRLLEEEIASCAHFQVYHVGVKLLADFREQTNCGYCHCGSPKYVLQFLFFSNFSIWHFHVVD